MLQARPIHDILDPLMNIIEIATNTRTPPPTDVITTNLNKIGRLIAELWTFETRPLMNINEIDTKNNRVRVHIMGHPPPERGRTLRC